MLARTTEAVLLNKCNDVSLLQFLRLQATAHCAMKKQWKDPHGAVCYLKTLTALSWKWFNLVVFWSPALKRNFLTGRSKPLFERFQRTIFLFPQLKHLFIALGLLNLTLLVLSLVVNQDHIICNPLTGRITHGASLALHFVLLFIQWRLPAVFRKLHILFEGLSVLTIAFANDNITQCSWITELGVVRVTFSAFYLLVVTIYFQYSTVLTVCFALYRLFAPLVLFGDSEVKLLTAREVSTE